MPQKLRAHWLPHARPPIPIHAWTLWLKVATSGQVTCDRVFASFSSEKVRLAVALWLGHFAQIECVNMEVPPDSLLQRLLTRIDHLGPMILPSQMLKSSR